MKIETVGLDELGIRLDTPYGSQSPNHALIVNDSSHTLIACDVVFEYTRDDGTIVPAYKTIIFGDVVSAPADARSSLLKNNPCIPPDSNMLIGLGMEPDMVRISNHLPELGEALVEVITSREVSFTKVTIRLNAVLFEDGSIAGPMGEQFREKINEALSEIKNREGLTLTMASCKRRSGEVQICGSTGEVRRSDVLFKFVSQFRNRRAVAIINFPLEMDAVLSCRFHGIVRLNE